MTYTTKRTVSSVQDAALKLMKEKDRALLKAAKVTGRELQKLMRLDGWTIEYNLSVPVSEEMISAAAVPHLEDKHVDVYLNPNITWKRDNLTRCIAHEFGHVILLEIGFSDFMEDNKDIETLTTPLHRFEERICERWALLAEKII